MLRYPLTRQLFCIFTTKINLEVTYVKRHDHGAWQWSGQRNLMETASRRRLVSQLYISSTVSPNSLSPIEHQWERVFWVYPWQCTTALSKYVRSRILQTKIIHRAYITPSRLKKTDNSLSQFCWHFCGEAGILRHLLQQCPSVRGFWNKVVLTLSSILKVKIPLCPLVCLLGIMLRNILPTLIKNKI